MDTNQLFILGTREQPSQQILDPDEKVDDPEWQPTSSDESEENRTSLDQSENGTEVANQAKKKQTENCHA